MAMNEIKIKVNDRDDEINQWIIDTVTGGWNMTYSGYNTLTVDFELEHEAVLFALTWA